MSEPILMALVQLFAIVAASVKKQTSANSRFILESYLGQHLRNNELSEYLKLFDELVFFHQPLEEIPEGESLDVSDKIQTICEKIQKQLSARDRLIVFVKFLEFLDDIVHENQGKSVEETPLAMKYINIFHSVFNQTDQEFHNACAFVLNPFGAEMQKQNLLIIGSDPSVANDGARFILRENLHGMILLLYVQSVRSFICRYLGNDEIYLNGHNVLPNRSFLFLNGSILNSLKITPIYHADIASQFLNQKEKVRIEFTAKDVEYRFKNSSNGIHPFSFTAGSGELIGVMGGSGVGKSTLLNILNGSLPLKNGQILINGHDLEKERDQLEGVVGFVPQDDLLIEELTVYQNLYYNARLCFSDFTEKQLKRTVMRVLMDIGLIGIRNLTVGDPLNKFISGGQRKRLNIALELIREPAILFADEPTSGLSSMDSEMVMLLLKEQTLQGRLVIVNIHQPSSDIYKLFDKLLIMDKGGYPIFYGNPIDALTYFKSATNHVHPTESECPTCGFVNPEQLLQITESKIFNEYGKLTNNRKVTPVEWYNLFKKTIQPELPIRENKHPLPKNHFKVPGWFSQFKIFSIRNLLTKVTNRQYMLINLLEAPFLAALLAYLTRYKFGDMYIFGDNRNLVPYLFMSVVVSLFLGMMVSAEEIIKDRKILKREAFLNLSRFSYLNSKIILLFVLSAIQTLLYVVVGNLILGIQGMTLSYWLILFSTSCFANMVGLNISAGLNSVVAIYILIPFILVPQLLLSGTIVAFDYLNPTIASRTHVPLVGNIMTSRWTFEALAVEQFQNNKYEKTFFPYDKEISRYGYITSYVIPTLKSELDECQRNAIKKENLKKSEKYITILKNEIPLLEKEAKFGAMPGVSTLSAKNFDIQMVEPLKTYLDSLSRFFSAKLTDVTAQKDALYESMVKRMGADAVYKLKQDHHNENLADLVLNKSAENKIIEGDKRLIRKKDPIFMDPTSNDGRAHFYAPVKKIGNLVIDTLWFNLAVIWFMSIILYVALLYDLLKRGINFLQTLHKR